MPQILNPSRPKRNRKPETGSDPNGTFSDDHGLRNPFTPSDGQSMRVLSADVVVVTGQVDRAIFQYRSR